jgi:hypothetical protein
MLGRSGFGTFCSKVIVELCDLGEDRTDLVVNSEKKWPQ